MIKRQTVAVSVVAVTAIQGTIEGKDLTWYRLYVTHYNDDGQIIGCKLHPCTKDFAEYCSGITGEVVTQQIAFDEKGRACSLY